jgi:dihydrofolate reductase
MGTLIYVTNLSLDGYIEDAHGALDWAPPDDDVFAATTNVVRSIDTFLYGRRLYEAMAVWETDPALAGQSELRADFASAWHAADKVVYSTTLNEVSTSSTRLEQRFDPDAVRDLKARTAGNLAIGGANLAAQALHAGLVDELHFYVWPVLLGGGKPGLSADVRTELELVDEYRFGNGVLQFRYRVLS